MGTLGDSWTGPGDEAWGGTGGAMPSKQKTLRRCLVVGALLAAAACSGSSPTQPPPISVQPSASPSTSPTPGTSPTPPVGTTCALGKGDVDAHCARTSARLLPDVDAAIDRVVKAHPQYFNTQEEIAPGAYRVLDARAYLDAVVKELGAAGFCSALLGDQLQVK